MNASDEPPLRFRCLTHGDVFVEADWAARHRPVERGIFCSACILDAPDADPAPMAYIPPAPSEEE